MGLCNSPDISQENMSELSVGLDTVRVYINDLLYITKGYWTDRITVLKEMSAHLNKSGLKVNSKKSCFCSHKFDYLGYHVTRDGIMYIPK